MNKENPQSSGSLLDPSERKELLRVNGLVITFIAAAIGNLFVLGLGLWFHNIALFRLELTYAQGDKEVSTSIHKMKAEILALEGVEKWEETSYVKSHNVAAAGMSDL